MKRFLIAFLFLLFLIVFLSEFTIAEDFTFRKTKWGMSKEQVKASESINLGREDADSLAYETSIIGKSVILLYYFVDNQLFKAIYWLDEKHINSNLYLKDYDQFKNLLIKKFRHLPCIHRRLTSLRIHFMEPSNSS